MQRLASLLLAAQAIAFCAIAWGFADALLYKIPPDAAFDLYLDDGQPHPAKKNNLALHEPESGCILGAYIDLDPDMKGSFHDSTQKIRRLPNEFEEKIGVRHGMYFFYLGYGRPAPTDWIHRLSLDGRYVHIAFEPNDGLDKVVDDEYLRDFADDLAATKAPIFLRYASEMNGGWVNYHGNPKLYREKFQLVSRVMKERAPNVAMVWCPFSSPVGNIPDYYPGDEWVDWVGVNIYSVTYLNQNMGLPAAHISPTTHLRYMYENYAQRKPLMICEYGAACFSSVENKETTAFASAKIREMYSSLQTQFPRVKAINYFNCNALILPHKRTNDYRITAYPRAAETYKEVVRDPWFIKSTSDALPDLALPMLEANGVVRKGSRVVLKSDETSATNATFMLDGRVLPVRSKERQWSAVIDTDEGRHILRVELLDETGRMISFRELAVVVKKQ